ncbi:MULTISPECIES: effector-associated domain 2-containing protein [Streptomyces]|uniref:effector-associated domain 2-containing protein n=1 Tax=Streptomyces TaxID=1883 RepID=UPI00287FA2FC|nr:caspase family protein [Streptomyces sp. CGMCC 4.1456]WNF65635.1 caspase family protein [Streptomyces sp. CGMCC 4.1456]
MTGPMPPVDPSRVHALVVGIEAYEAGDAWRLPGPARDAVRFWRLLRGAGVPTSQLRLHLSPLPSYDPEVPYESASQATLRRVLVRELSPAQGDMLWVWWGGHGVLDRAGRLRLFCADAGVDDKVGIDLDSALLRYAGGAVPGLREQMWIVDACETFEEDLAFQEALPADALPVGQPSHTHRQTVLRAAGRGRAAANDPVRATGLFSDVLLGLLADRAAVLPAPPDPEELFPAVRARIASLREEGRTLQHPEIRLQSPDRTETLPPAGPPAAPRPLAALQRAVEALLDYPLMHDPDERQTVVAALNPRVTAVLRRHSRARTDVVNILGGLARRTPEALWDLFDAVVSVDDDPELKEELVAALTELAAASGRRRDGR